MEQRRTNQKRTLAIIIAIVLLLWLYLGLQYAPGAELRRKVRLDTQRQMTATKAPVRVEKEAATLAPEAMTPVQKQFDATTTVSPSIVASSTGAVPDGPSTLLPNPGFGGGGEVAITPSLGGASTLSGGSGSAQDASTGIPRYEVLGGMYVPAICRVNFTVN